ncbi:Arabinose-proton symporter [Acidisarcina polymorpha]|uniref:Arabinose-proton symporter n=2 Tax=Acidisarcina polymorpha TaxID=2211140 RepID=A0A2Z5G2V7_9BACT|nr:Arabinose-proton symporter [Acidisarcina polymorpha]
MNRYLLKGTAVGALGGLLFGFDTAVIAGATHQLTEVYSLTPSQLGLTVAIALVGTVIGAMSAGAIGQKFGGRDTLRVMAVLYVISALGSGFAWSWYALLAARFIGGLGIGGSSVLGPVYIAELAPAKWRGRLVGMFQVNIVIGILLAYFSNFVIAQLHLGATQWRWQLGIAALPAVLFLIMLFGIPRSSRWLVTQDRVDEARLVLELMGSPNSEAELKEIVDSIHLERAHKSEPLFSWKYRKPIFLAASIGMFNQLSGINAILYYLNDIFAAAGFSRMSGDLQAVAIGAMNLVATLIAMTVIDRLGRRTLLLVGSVGTAICLAGVSAVFFTNSHHELLVWLLVGFIAFFAFSQGAVIWVYISEVFPTKVRSKGQSLGSSSHWIMNAAIAYTFPLLAKSSGAYPFVFFSAMMVLQFFVVLFAYPETKGVTLEQLQHQLGIE